MSLPRYPEYKDSGVERLGSVPAHWRVVRLKALLRETDVRAGDSPHELLGLSKTLGVRRRADLGQSAAESDDYGKYKVVTPGQLVMNRMQAWNGVFGVSGYEGIVSPDYATFQVITSEHAPFLSAILRTDLMSGEFFTRCRGMGTAFLRINIGDFLDVKVPLPPTEEIVAIAKFLGRETGRIDALIAEQEKLLALLAEKRQATISHAVTRGLDPSVPMKDSGIAWLGEVPAHWEVLPVKRVGQLKAGAGFPHGEQGLEDEELPFFKVAALSGADESDFLLPRGDSISRATASRLGAAIFPANTIVFAKVGAALLLGRIRKLSGEACIDNNLMALVVSEGHNSDFIRSALELVKFDLLANPGAVPSLNASQVGSWFVPCPPCAEQVRIARFLAEQKARFALLEGQCAQSIGLLIERRSAVISAAVTGQIDVRGLVEAGAS